MSQSEIFKLQTLILSTRQTCSPMLSLNKNKNKKKWPGKKKPTFFNDS